MIDPEGPGGDVVGQHDVDGVVVAADDQHEDGREGGELQELMDQLPHPAAQLLRHQVLPAK